MLSDGGCYSSARPAHFGRAQAPTCDLDVSFPSGTPAVVLRAVKAHQLLVVREP